MSIFRDTFDKTIASSISKRQEAMINRTPENIQYLNSRNAWIRMTSAVNVNGTNTLASQYILQGGTLNSNGTLKSGVGNSNTDVYSTVSPSGKTHKFGIRPMPGISSLDIKSKTAYGSLREATVKFHCWDMTQLEDLELLYMRPGYTVLVEWGWLPYIDNGGKYHSTFTNFYSDDLLNFKAGSKTREQIFKELYQKSIDYSGNYDAMYGYIKNYEWSAREDGGYDCTTTIISTGEIIESLKVNYVRADLKKWKMYDSGSKGDGYLNPLFEKDKQGETPSTKFADYYQKNTLAGIWAELNFKLKDPNAKTKFTGFTVSSFPGLTNYGDFDTFIQPGSGLKVYINLESAFEILNKYAIAQSEEEPLIKLSTKAESYSKKGKDDEKNKENDLLCVAHPLQVSIDPTVCLIKSPLWYEKVAPAISGSADVISTIVANSLNQTSTPPATTGVTSTGTTPTTPTTPPPPPSPPTAQDKDTAKKAYDLIIDAVAGIGTDGPKLASGLRLITNRQIFDEVQILLSQYDDQDFGSLQKIFNEEIDSDDFDFSVTCRDILLKAGVDTIFEVHIYPAKGKPYLKKINEINVNTLKTEKAVLKVKTKSFKLTYSNATSTTPATTFSATGGTVTATTAATASASDPTASTTTVTTVLFSVTDAIASLQNLEKLKGFFYKDEPNRELGIISNIYVSLDFLYRQALSQNLESGDGKEKSEINLYGYLKSVMSGIQTALGSVNNFEIHVDPIDNIARVIDVNYTAPNKPSNLFELQVHKTNSTVRSYKLQSQVFPSQTTIVSTASQTRGGQMGIQNNTMIEYNRKITDRIIQKKQDPSINATINTDDVDKDNNLASILAGVVLLFGFLGAKPVENAPSTLNIGELISKSKSAMRDLIVYFQTLQSESPGRNRNIIPTKFSFTMDGIGGLIVGSLFRINKDILPTGYKGEDKIGKELAKVITGISHRISDGDWTTEIDTQTFILDRPEFGTFGRFNIVPLIKKSLEQIIKEKVGFPPPPPVYIVNGFNAGGGGGPIVDPGGVGSDANLFFYFTWNQGPSGAAQHYSLYKRNGRYKRYTTDMEDIISNWPGSQHGKTAGNRSSKGVAADNVETLYKSGRHEEIAEAFVELWRPKFVEKAATGLKLINSNGKNRTGTPYSTIKAVFEKYGPSNGIPVSTLATFGYIENSLCSDTDPKKKYQGPWQMDSQKYYADEIRKAIKTKLPNGNINYDWDNITSLAIVGMVKGWTEFKSKSGFVG